MEFSSVLFLYCLLPLLLLAYFLIPDVGRKNALLILASLLLYTFVQPVYLPLLLLLCRFNFNAGLKVKKGRKSTVMLPVAVNISILFLLKYLDPLLLMMGLGTASGGVLAGLIGRLVDAMNAGGMTLNKPASLAPLGISFFVLGALSYLLDIYRGRHPAERSFKNFLLYMSFFPKLFQGPLVRYDQMSVQVKERRENWRLIFEGALRFCTGLGKKVLLADYCGSMIDGFVAVKSDLTLTGSWMIAVLFLFRVYYDFSACCDMAVGLGKIFGFRIPENFNLPFMAMSVTDFCQRWNLTLGSFFREHVYTPLSDKREGPVNGFLALLITVVLGSLWHGGTFNFMILGLFLFAVFEIEQNFEDFLTELPYWLRHVLTVLVLLVASVLFRNCELESLGSALKAMIGDGGVGVLGDGKRVLNAIPLIAACWVGVTDIPRRMRIFLRRFCGVAGKQEGKALWLGYVYIGLCFVFMVLILWWCTLSRIGNGMQPSIFLNL